MNKKRDPKSVNKWSYNSPEFLDKIHLVLEKMRVKKTKRECRRGEDAEGRTTRSNASPRRFELSLQEQLEALRTGLNNLKTGAVFTRWDCEDYGAKDSGCENFPFCGMSGYKTIRCPFDTGAELLSGCWYRCSIQKETQESAIAKIEQILTDVVEVNTS